MDIKVGEVFQHSHRLIGILQRDKIRNHKQEVQDYAVTYAYSSGNHCIIRKARESGLIKSLKDWKTVKHHQSVDMVIKDVAEGCVVESSIEW